MKTKLISLIIILYAVRIFPQENPDSLYRVILSNRNNGNLSIIQVDKTIALEMQKSPKVETRLSELFFYRGELLQNEKRYWEAISAYDSALSYPSEEWIPDKTHFNRGLVYENLGMIKSRQKATEKLAASQLFWFGEHAEAEFFPLEFKKAEADYQAIESLTAKERLMQLYLVAGKTDEADRMYQGLSLMSHSDEAMNPRVKAYEILLLEGKENFIGADSLMMNIDPIESGQAGILLNDIRSRRLARTINFDWVDSSVHEVFASLSRIKNDVESSPYPVLDLHYSLKRLVFDNINGGLLVSGKVESFGLYNDNRGGFGADIHMLGTYLYKNFSCPGGGFSFGFKSFEGAGKRILKIDDAYVLKKSETGFGFNLNAGIKHKLLAFAVYDQKSTWLNGVSENLSISREMFDSLNIEVIEARRTNGVYGMGVAGTGWWPGKSDVASSRMEMGFNTNLFRNLTLGASYLLRSSNLTDHEEITVNKMDFTYAHSIFVNERISLLRLNAETRVYLFGFELAVGGHHGFKSSSRILLNERNARIVKSIPESNGINDVVLNYSGEKMGTKDVAYAKKITGYFPSVSQLYFRLNYSNLVFSAEYTINGLRAKNEEVRFSLGIKTKGKFVLQCLHDLAWCR